MNSNDIIQSDKPIRVYCCWTCGEGCCSESMNVEIPAGKYIAVEVCDILDMKDYVCGSHHWSSLRVSNADWADYEYSEEDRD